MVKDLDPIDIHRFIANDFSGAWDSIANNVDPTIARGNFMFASQGMTLLEFIARLCSTDRSTHALNDYSNELFGIESKYFTELPSPCAHTSDFELPSRGNTSGNLLLWALFDLIRNGLAHQYQQIIVDLNDENQFYFTLTGPEVGRSLNAVRFTSRPDKHLGYRINSDNDVQMQVFPEILFFDFEDALNSSGILQRNLEFPYLKRPRQKKSYSQKQPGTKYYDFDSASLVKCLASNNHTKI